jgi:hypothetical protein
MVMVEVTTFQSLSYKDLSSFMEGLYTNCTSDIVESPDQASCSASNSLKYSIYFKSSQNVSGNCGADNLYRTGTTEDQVDTGGWIHYQQTVALAHSFRTMFVSCLVAVGFIC